MIEGIVAHEYFHNWTGNRITCRDWFQLCLKEGLTVFRDQQFTGDQRSRAVKRIEDVLQLRGRQFREDNGPAGPPRPPGFLHRDQQLLHRHRLREGRRDHRDAQAPRGRRGYAKALDLYFDRHDGEAATIEDWLRVFEDATGRDLTQFRRWYTQAGTPRLTVAEDFADGRYTLTFTQATSPTPGQPDKRPQVIPIALGLLNPNGDEVLPTTVLELTEATQSFTFDGLAAKPVPSLLRGFSAPVILDRPTTTEERAFLLAHDTDPFNKWEAGRQLAKDVLSRMVTEGASPGPAYLDALLRVARDGALDPAFRALALRLPSEDDMAQTLHDASVTPDPEVIHEAREKLARAVASHLAPALPGLYEEMDIPGPYTPDAKAAGCRSLRLAALSYLARLDGGKAAEKQFRDADNMTEQTGALSVLLDIGQGQPEVQSFHRQWRHDRLVMDKWFSLQVAHAAPRAAAATAG
jgi:aminopeptidase N